MSPRAPTGGQVSVVIPVLNAAAYMRPLLEGLLAQQPEPPREILIVDSGSKDATCEIACEFERVRIVPIADFTHGGARNLGVREATGEIVVLLTQDALPHDANWLERLLAPLAESGVAAAFSRQVPRSGAKPMEKFFLRTRFPDSGQVRRALEEGETATLEKVFFSNVSAAVHRELVLRHPFDEELIMSEDQQWARDVLQAGFTTVYESASVVVHSHDYPLTTVFRRYFDSVHSLTVIFPTHGFRTSATLGGGYLGKELRYMLGRPWWLPYYSLYTIAKTAGTLCGHFATSMPTWLARWMSLHRYHWK